MDTNIDVLDEINKGCSMGLEAVDMIMKKANENEYLDLLSDFHDDYVKLSDKIRVLYHDYTDSDIHEVNTAEKMMAWYGIMKDTMLDDIIEGRKILNHKKMDKKVHNLCEEFVNMQEKYVEKLKKYL